jgi:hypothetical protein
MKASLLPAAAHVPSVLLACVLGTVQLAQPAAMLAKIRAKMRGRMQPPPPGAPDAESHLSRALEQQTALAACLLRACAPDSLQHLHPSSPATHTLTCATCPCTAVSAGVTTLLAFGDLASSVGNMPVGDTLGSMADQLGPLLDSGLAMSSCCQCCGADMGACTTMCSACCQC